MQNDLSTGFADEASQNADLQLNIGDIQHNIDTAIKYEQRSPSETSSVVSSVNYHCDREGGENNIETSPSSTMDTASRSAGSGLNNHRAAIRGQTISNNGNQTSSFNPKEFEDVKQVDLFGSRIVALTINGRERLCLAQISNTLLKDFSYNEIHNRRVALGITCVQCTPIQLEMLRRAGAMPSSSRRCGMITRREAERLCRSFLVEEQPPELPENFYFTVAHRVNYGCKGRFVPARYISSRAKCIECFYCGEYYSPNKFIFHSHRQPHVSDCNPPDSPNINSWRKHIDLDWTMEHSQDVRYAWEDVKSLFNGGTRRRAPNPQLHLVSNSKSATQANINSRSGSSTNGGARRSCGLAGSRRIEDDQLIDVEFDDQQPNESNLSEESKLDPGDDAKKSPPSQPSTTGRLPISNLWSSPANKKTAHCLPASDLLNNNQNGRQQMASQQPVKRSFASAINGQANNRKGNGASGGSHKIQRLCEPDETLSTNLIMGHAHRHNLLSNTNARACGNGSPGLLAPSASHQLPAHNARSILVDELLNPEMRRHTEAAMSVSANNKQAVGLNYQNTSTINAPTSNSFIYNQLYSQLMQPQQAANDQQQQQQQQQIASAFDAQMALRHHLWSSLLANLQCGGGATSGASDSYNLQRQQHQPSLVAMQHQQQQQCNSTTMINHEATTMATAANLSHLTGQLAHNLHSNALQGPSPDDLSARFQMTHRFSPPDTSSI